MKKIFFIQLFVISFITSSCYNSYEDELILNDSETYGAVKSYTDELSIAYSTLRTSGSANHGGYFSVQSVSSDELAITQKGGDWYDGGIWIDMHRHTWNSSNFTFDGVWNQTYNAITEVNSTLRNTNISNHIAQLKILRAFYHLRLMDLFGRIKYVTESGASAQLSRSDAFFRIHDDLLAGLGITLDNVTGDLAGALASSPLGTTDNKYRINQYAALGILAKLYLNAEVYIGTSMYEEAEAAASYIIDNSSYYIVDETYNEKNLSKRPSVEEDSELITGYSTIFAPNNENNPEIIWSIMYDETLAAGNNFNQMSLHYLQQETYQLNAQPWNGYVVLEDFYNMYHENDIRKSSNFIAGEQTDFYGNTLLDYSSINDYGVLTISPSISQLEPNAGRKEGVRFKKFSFKIFGTPDSDNDYPLVRLGEIYLIRAEAKARNAGDWSLAASDVNILRARAGLENLTITADTFLEERGREMFMESSRRTDLIRFGKWEASWWEKPSSSSYRTLMPIPMNVILNSNGTITQNPGY